MKLHQIHQVVVKLLIFTTLCCSATDQRDDVREHVWTPCLDLIPPVTTSHPVLSRYAAERAKVKHTLHTAAKTEPTATDAAKVMHLERQTRTTANGHECAKLKEGLLVPFSLHGILQLWRLWPDKQTEHAHVACGGNDSN